MIPSPERITVTLIGARASSVQDIYELSGKVTVVSEKVDHLPKKQEIQNLRTNDQDLGTKVANLETSFQDLGTRVTNLEITRLKRYESGQADCEFAHETRLSCVFHSNIGESLKPYQLVCPAFLSPISF